MKSHQNREEEKKNKLRTIEEEEEPQIWNTSVQTYQDFDCYEPKKQKKGFWEDDYTKTDNIHPASLFEALFPTRSEEKKPEPKSKSTSKSKSDHVDLKKNTTLLIKEKVDKKQEKKLNADIVENYVETKIEKEEYVPAYRNMPKEKMMKPEKARRRPKVDNEEGKKVYECPFCNRSTRSPEKITKHLEQIHKREIIQQAMKEKFPVKKDRIREKSEPEADVPGPCTKDTTPVKDEAGQAHPLDVKKLLRQGNALDLDTQNDNMNVSDTRQEYKRISNKENMQIETCRDKCQACAYENIDNNQAETWKEMIRSNGTARAVRHGFKYLKQVISPI